MLKIPYAGCDVIGAAVGQDKVVMKHILQNSGLPVCPWFWLYGHEFAHKQDCLLYTSRLIQHKGDADRVK